MIMAKKTFKWEKQKYTTEMTIFIHKQVETGKQPPKSALEMKY